MKETILVLAGILIYLSGCGATREYHLSVYPRIDCDEVHSQLLVAQEMFNERDQLEGVSSIEINRFRKVMEPYADCKSYNREAITGRFLKSIFWPIWLPYRLGQVTVKEIR